MKIINNKISILTLLVIASAFHFMRCGNQADRGTFFHPTHNKDTIENIKPQPPTTLRQVIEGPPGKFSKPRANRIINLTVRGAAEKLILNGKDILELKASDRPWDKAVNFLDEIGTEPYAPPPSHTRQHIYTERSYVGLRYINLGFNVISVNGEDLVDEAFIAFEFEPYKGVFEDADFFLKENLLGEDATPCFDNSLNNKIYKKGDMLVKIFEETEDSLDLNSPYPPRSLDDIGSVRVSISKGGHPHGNEVACFDSDTHSHPYTD